MKRANPKEDPEKDRSSGKFLTGLKRFFRFLRIPVRLEAIHSLLDRIPKEEFGEVLLDLVLSLLG